jgi:hypothetical protein
MRIRLITVLCFLTLGLAAVPVGAQTRTRCVNNNRVARRYDQRLTNVYNGGVYRDSRYRNEVYRDSRYQDNGYNGYYDNRSRWETSRDKITTAIGAGAGAGLGAVVGGKKGAIIGGIAGGGGAALWTYVLRDRNNHRSN